jgi:heme A synthase
VVRIFKESMKFQPHFTQNLMWNFCLKFIVTDVKFKAVQKLGTQLSYCHRHWAILWFWLFQWKINIFCWKKKKKKGRVTFDWIYLVNT